MKVTAGPLTCIVPSTCAITDLFEAVKMPRLLTIPFFPNLIVVSIVHYVYKDELPLRIPTQATLSLIISVFEFPSCLLH